MVVHGALFVRLYSESHSVEAHCFQLKWKTNKRQIKWFVYLNFFIWNQPLLRDILDMKCKGPAKPINIPLTQRLYKRFYGKGDETQSQSGNILISTSFFIFPFYYFSFRCWMEAKDSNFWMRSGTELHCVNGDGYPSLLFDRGWPGELVLILHTINEFMLNSAKTRLWNSDCSSSQYIGTITPNPQS